jgi:tRNA(Arg) A34 adenosine deaminase TadA
MKNDLFFMERAYEQALLGFKKEEIPVGAVVVYENEIISEAHNESISKTDPTSHAEIEAIREAALKIGNYRLTDATMYVTLEPCLMCCGALIHARFDKVIFSTKDEKSGAVLSNGNLLEANFVNHYVKFELGPLQKESSALLKKFFKNKRSKA